MTLPDLASDASVPSAPRKMRGAHAWIWIVLLYIAVIGAFGVMVTIAIRNPPQYIPVEDTESSGAAHGRR